MSRLTIRLVPLCLVAILAACGSPAIQGVATVEVVGGDRSVPLGPDTLLTALVTAGSGVDTSVTWASSDDAVASVNANGVVTTHSLGDTTITATSVADPSKSGSAVLTVRVPNVEQDSAFMAQYTPASGAPPVLGASLLLFDSDALGPAAVVEIAPGFYSGPVSSMLDDDTLVVTLPPFSDLPATVFSPADEFLYNLESITDCTLDASSASAEVTMTAFEFITIPGVGLWTTAGMMFGVAASAQLDFSSPPPPEVLADLEIYTWLYATEAVSVTTVGAGCSSGPYSMAVDVDLVEGWNQVAWTLELDDTDDVAGYSLGNAQLSDIFVMPGSPIL